MVGLLAILVRLSFVPERNLWMLPHPKCRIVIALIATSLFTLSYTGTAQAVTIVDVSGAGDTGLTIDDGEAAAISFTLSQDATNVSIDIEALCIGCTGGYWLNTNAIGPTSSFADTLFGVAFDNTTRVAPLFSGLSLAAGDYFVVLSIDTGFALWTGSTSPTVTEHPNGTRQLDFFASSAGAWAPMSDFSVEFGKGLDFNVSGTFVPEPGSGLLLGMGIIALALRSRRRGDC